MPNRMTGLEVIIYLALVVALIIYMYFTEVK